MNIYSDILVPFLTLGKVAYKTFVTCFKELINIKDKQILNKFSQAKQCTTRQ